MCVFICNSINTLQNDVSNYIHSDIPPTISKYIACIKIWKIQKTYLNLNSYLSGGCYKTLHPPVAPKKGPRRRGPPPHLRPTRRASSPPSHAPTPDEERPRRG